MSLTLRTVKQTDYATYSRLLNEDGHEECVTLELPWKNNQRGVSCIPAGTYTAERYFSPDHGYTLFRLIDVPDRSDVELHIGCLPRDSRGCILLGTVFGHVDYADGKPGASGEGVTGSHTAFHSFMASHPEQRFTLVVERP